MLLVKVVLHLGLFWPLPPVASDQLRHFDSYHHNYQYPENLQLRLSSTVTHLGFPEGEAMAATQRAAS